MSRRIQHKLRAHFRLSSRPGPATSYFGEDIVFERLMKPRSSGTYVDVGAHDPIVGSNTYRLYRRGWRGLAVDPNPKFSEAFRRHRPKDTHVTAGAALAHCSMTYHVFDPDVFNTLSADHAAKIVALGKRKIGETSVPCRPLSEIVAEHLDSRQIDLLNVDCEGMDIDALRSLDLEANRPTVILVEDYARFVAFRDGLGPSEMDVFLRGRDYSPIAQSAWSAVFVANDWRDLVRRSEAFDLEQMQRGYLPAKGQ